MAFQKIFEQAHTNPDKPAIFYRGHRIGYGEFAYWIARSREFLAGQNLRSGSVAVLLGVPCRLDGWALDFALRSLGLDTIAVRTVEEFDELGLRNIGCVITTIHDRQIRVAPGNADYKVIRIPHPMYLGQSAGTVPEMPETIQPAGGHILLTSGTTGARKKVLIGVASLSVRIARHCEVYSISEHSIVNVLDFAMWTGAGYKLPLCAWSMGGAVVFHQDEAPHRSLAVDGITHAVFTPDKLAELLKAPAAELRKLPEMRAFVAGAPLSRALAAATEQRLTSQIFTFVASTEAGMWALTRIDRPEDLDSHVIHGSVEVQVVDRAGRAVPAGAMGEIGVRATDGVTGYFEDEAATREVFRDGYFYPGDLGEFRADGRLVLLGRASSVISVRGMKLAAEPLERTLQEKLGADAICLLSMQGNGVQEELHAVIQSKRAMGAAETKALIRATLPYSPDAEIHFVESIPRNELGKIDRISLRQRISGG